VNEFVVKYPASTSVVDGNIYLQTSTSCGENYATKFRIVLSLIHISLQMHGLPLSNKTTFQCRIEINLMIF
jgi:hypothetical protein